VRIEFLPWVLAAEVLAGRSLRYHLAVDAGNLDPIERDLVSGTWVPSPAFAWLLSVIDAGDKVLDLGAHIGTFAIPAAAAGAEVTAVEASPRNAALLEAARRENGFENRLKIVASAVDRVPGTLTFLDAGPVSTIETATVGSASGDLTFTVDAVTVDQVEGGPFRWAKMDIEGAEERALAGAARTLGHLKAFVVESNGHALSEQGSSPTTLAALIRNSGFDLYGAEGRMLFPIGQRFFQPETNVDYVAVAGELPLPRGWTLGPPRRARELAAALHRELQHPVAEHHRYARAIVSQAPVGVRVWLAAGAARRRFGRRSSAFP
jgi:FkbM family methyltransferase